ncbi:MAG TPA: hypothetical protein VHL54_06680 [Actinomycetota bacterium]|nr:hypothetical protein [Actinomycetota bacterium]
MRRLLLFAAVGLSALAMLPGLASGSPTNTGPAEGKVIRLVERIQAFELDDRGVSGASLGDRVIFSSDLFTEDGKAAGRDGADCVVIRLEHAAPAEERQVVNCTVSVELSDGQITFQGLAQGLNNTFAVTGGTGAYRNARGQAFVRDREFLREADIEIRLIG